ncbi:hypothetical protein IFM89_011158, partial [Coptis chinensis]
FYLCFLSCRIMLSELMDQRSASPSSYLFDQIRCPTTAERQVGFWSPDAMLDHQGRKSVPSSPLEKIIPLGARAVEFLEFPQSCLVRNQKQNRSLEQHVVGAENSTNLSMTSWRSVDLNFGTRSEVFVQPASYFAENNKIKMEDQYENVLFSSSMSELFSKKLRLSTNNFQSGNAVTPHSDEDERFETLEEIEAQTIGNLLPDDEDLLSGVNDNLEYIAQHNIRDDIEDFDLFSSGGGMELEGENGLTSSRSQRNSDFSLEGLTSSSIAGLHPYGKHPSRTLFVRNINSNLEDSELRALFEHYGDIRTLYTACKHRGFIMISYYDIRAACDAIRALQNKPLRRRNLDIHFSIPKDNPSEKDINQGTLAVFNLDFSFSNDNLHKIFSVYGEIKEIRENPYKLHHKFIEFYDVRATEAALCALNRSDIAGKRIKLEPSRPGSETLCSAGQSSPKLEKEERAPSLQQGSPPIITTSGYFGPVSHGVITSSCLENGSVKGLHSPVEIGVPGSKFMENGFYHGLPPSVPQRSRVSPVGNVSGLGDPGLTLNRMDFNFQHMPNFRAHSLPEYHDGLASNFPYTSPGTMAANISSTQREAVPNGHIQRVGIHGHSVERNDEAFGSGNGNCPLHGQQYMWSNSNTYHPHPPNTMMWSNSPCFVNGGHGPSPPLSGLSRTVLPIQHHHVGSAPTVNPSLWDKRHVYEGEYHEASGFHPGSLGSMGLSGNSNLHHLDLGSHIFPNGSGNCMDLPIASTNVGLHSPQQRHHMFPHRNSMIHMPNSFEAPNERVMYRRNEVSSNLADNKKQYDLDIDRILHGEDTRTTLMIKNIPNKYVVKFSCFL